MQIKHKRTICSGWIAIIGTLFVWETVQTIQGEGEQALTLAKVRLMMTKNQWWNSELRIDCWIPHFNPPPSFLSTNTVPYKSKPYMQHTGKENIYETTILCALPFFGVWDYIRPGLKELTAKWMASLYWYPIRHDSKDPLINNFLVSLETKEQQLQILFLAKLHINFMNLARDSRSFLNLRIDMTCRKIEEDGINKLLYLRTWKQWWWINKWDPKATIPQERKNC